MKSTKAKTLGVCIATLAFLLIAVGSSSTESGGNSSDSNGNTTTTATTTKAATTKKVETVSYSSNDKSTVKKGNKGLYSYENKGGLYYIIDFDGGYVYNFSKLDSTCDRLKIVSGNLNDVLIITYHDVDGSSWSYGLHFKWQNQPDHLILQDQKGTEYDFYTTNLKDALSLLQNKTVTDYSDASATVVDKNDLPTYYSANSPSSTTSDTVETTSNESETTTVPISEDISSETTDALPAMIDVTGMTLDKAKKQLKENGFSNIKTESDNGKIIMLESNWTVIAQSVEAGTTIDKNAEIILTCSKGEDTTAVDETTAATTTAIETTTSPETTVNNSTESKDIGFYDISLLNSQTRIELNTKIDTYLKTMLALLTNIANNDGLEKALVEVNDWTKIPIINKFPSTPNFSARIVPLYEDKSCYAFLIETAKAKDFGDYLVKLKDQGFGSGFTATDWIMIFDADTEAEIQLIQYVSNNNTYVFVRVGLSE